MPEITVHARPLIAAGNRCRQDVLDLVNVAKGAFADGEGSTSGGATAALRSSAAAETCVSTWLAAFTDARTTMDAVGGKLVATAAAVHSADDDAADLYRGPRVELPSLTIDVGSE